MSTFHPCCLPTTVGSTPHTDPVAACDFILRHTPDIPAWPQLPKRSAVERIYTQYLWLFPGAVAHDDRLQVNTALGFDEALERLYTDHLADDFHRYQLGPERAAGFTEMCGRLRQLKPTAVKGQVIGPISAALQTTDQALRPILFDEILADAMAKYLRLVARAHEQTLSTFSDRTIVMIDEPFLNTVWSGIVPLGREQVEALLGEVLGGLRGLKGIHCCDNTDWALVLSLPIDVLSFDAYTFADAFVLYSDDIKRYLRRGGIVAWGIVPTEPQAIVTESVERLTDRFAGILDVLEGKGIDRDELLSASMITPSCGLGTLSLEAAERAMALTAGLTTRMRGRFLGLPS